jgi:hypothetical protein
VQRSPDRHRVGLEVVKVDPKYRPPKTRREFTKKHLLPHYRREFRLATVGDLVFPGNFDGILRVTSAGPGSACVVGDDTTFDVKFPEGFFARYIEMVDNRLSDEEDVDDGLIGVLDDLAEDEDEDGASQGSNATSTSGEESSDGQLQRGVGSRFFNDDATATSGGASQRSTSTPASEDEAGDGDGEETNEEVLQRHRDEPVVQALFKARRSAATLRALMDVDATAIADGDGSGGSGSGVDGDESESSSCASGMSRGY